MSKQFLRKIGHISEDSFILLDGEVSVHGLFMNEKLGTLFPGSHVSVSLAADAPGEIAKKINMNLFNSQSIVSQLDPEDNLEGKATFHLVANTFVQVGVLTAEDLQVLFKAYPKWKVMFQTLNRFLFNLGVASLERFVKSKNREPTRKDLN